MNNFDLSQAVGDALGLEKVGFIKVSFGDEFVGLYLGDLGQGFDNYVEGLRAEFGYTGDYQKQRLLLHPNFSQDMNTAWRLVEAMRQAGFRVTIQSKGESGHDIFFWNNETNIYNCYEGYLPTTILKAAARALGVTE